MTTRNAGKLSSFCLNRIATRVRVRSPQIVSKANIVSCKDAATSSTLAKLNSESSSNSERGSGDRSQEGKSVGRRIMIVVDSSKESKDALQWALSHTIQAQDTVILVNPAKPSSRNGGGDDEPKREVNGRSHRVLSKMKSICHAAKPKVEVETSVVEGKERGPAIVEEALKQDASLLVLGQKKRSMTWRLVMMWAGGGQIGGGGSSGMVDYCTQNANCMTLAVRRKSRKGGGGYLITTRRHKDFWLLA